MLTLPLQAQMQAQQFAPARYAPAACATSVHLTYSHDLYASTAANVGVFSQLAGGRKAGTATVAGRTVTFDPATNFKAGETVLVTSPTSVLSSSEAPSKPLVYQFTTQVKPSSGTFATSAEATLGFSPSSTAVADIDGDGDLDLLATNSSPNWVSVHLNDGKGNFSEDWTESGVGRSPKSLRMADFDNDGDLDFVVISGGGNGASVSVGLNDGTGHFPGRTSVDVGFTTTTDRLVTVGDVDGDGSQDLLIAADGGIFVSLNNGTGRFGALSPKLAVTQTTAVDMNTADLDNDGDLDLLVATTSAHRLHVLLNNGAGQFSYAYALHLPASPSALATADIDGDGDLDVLTTSYASPAVPGTVTLLRNNGAGILSDEASILVGKTPSGLLAADLDGDGDLDLLTTNDGDGTLSIRRNDGHGNFSSSTDLAAGPHPSGLLAADLDGDGDLDLVTRSRLVEKARVFFNGTAVLAAAADKPVEPAYVYPNPAQDDFVVEYTVASAQPATLTLLDPLGRCVYQQTVRLAAGRNHFSLSGAALSSGIYYLTLTPIATPATSQKIMITH
ncbi:hypothetical protein BXP70_11050 [Hymenobacter crusticola]|uniref:Secretion system C-terminal sorting domain-containing protein n=1 Tax=Hymenobacter crusticola TaxID=1770526 RepID=A0A243WEU3_9BACT|nr:hypothetical protein BXP70_11050 [Hymenobacter crusticola]